MGYRILADLTLILHAAFILFVLFGGLLCLHHKRWAWLHLPAACWGIWVEWAGWICPLTPLENHFRKLAFDQAYSGGFIEHHLTKLIYPQNLTVALQVLLGTVVILINVAVYVFIWHRHNNHPRSVDE